MSYVFTMAQTAGTGDDVIAAAQTVTQYAPQAIDLSAHTSTGDRLYAIDLPEGMGLMTEAHRIIGAPTTTQGSTTHNVYCQTAVGDNFWIRIDIEVEAPGGATYTDITSWSDMIALDEFGTSYTGAGCVIELGANVVIDQTSPNVGNNNRFKGLTSPIVIKSADPTQPAKITGRSWDFSGDGGTTGNVSFVDMVTERDQPSGVKDWDDNITAANIIGSGGTAQAVGIAFIRCTFQSDVPLATERVHPSDEVWGFSITKDPDKIAIYDCTFKRLFNGITIAGQNFYAAKNRQIECWGDMLRLGTSTSYPTARYVLMENNRLYNTTSNGFIRHADGLQTGVRASTTCSDIERRADLSFEGTAFRELPSISPFYGPRVNGGHFYEGSASQTAVSTNWAIYMMRTDDAAGDLTVTLPSTAGLDDGFTLVVQKYSGDETHDVIVARNGATIDGVGSDYTFSGSWMAVYFTKSGSNWTTSFAGVGIQHGLYQTLGGDAASIERMLCWATMAVGPASAGHSFQIRATDAKVENVSFARLVPDDHDGDGIITANDGFGVGPLIQQRYSGTGSSDLTVTKCVTPDVQSDVTATGTLTVTDSDESQTSADDSTTTALFMGEGGRPSTPEEMIWMMQHKSGGALAGTGRGAVGFGPATHGYDFVNNRTRIPGYIECTGPTVIELSGSTYQIATAAIFDRAGTGARQYQWCVDHVPIPGQTGATLTQANAPAGLITCREIIPDTTYGDCITESNRIAEA